MQNAKQNIIVFALDNTQIEDIGRLIETNDFPSVLTKLVMLAHGLSTANDPRSYDIINFIVKNLSQQLLEKGEVIDLLTLNNALQDLCFSLHPTKVGKEGYLDVTKVEWYGIH